jgi:hypothetical protein
MHSIKVGETDVAYFSIALQIDQMIHDIVIRLIVVIPPYINRDGESGKNSKK